MQYPSTAFHDKFDSIIFDLDGTLWDSTGNVALAWEHARKQMDFAMNEITVESVRAVTGMPYDHIFELMLPDVEPVHRDQFKRICAKSEIDTLHAFGGELYPGLEETIRHLAGKYRLFIVSNCQNGYIETFLRHCPVSDLFSGHQCFGTKGRPKAENIRDIVAAHALKSAVYVGDTTGDRDSAAKAGVPFIFASYGFGDVDGGMIATIDRLSDLRKIL